MTKTMTTEEALTQIMGAIEEKREYDRRRQVVALIRRAELETYRGVR
jgi:hypothetical protein